MSKSNKFVMVGETTQEIEFFGGEVETRKVSTVSAAIQTATIILSVLSVTFGVYIVLATVNGNL